MPRTHPTVQTVQTRVGPVPVRISRPGGAAGADGPVVLAVHGLLLDGRLWDGVAAHLAAEMTVVMPDLPLGAHPEAVPERSQLTPPMLAGALVDVLDALGHQQAVVLGNDTGGALTQIAVATYPERFSAMVLTSCDALRHFPPPLLAWLPRAARLPGVARGVVQFFSLPALFARPGWANLLSARGVDSELVASWLGPARQNRQVLADTAAFLRTVAPSHTLQAAEAIRAFPRPIVLAWSRRDRIFPPSDAETLAGMWPTAQLHWIDDALTFSPLDQPGRVADAVRVAVGALAAR